MTGLRHLIAAGGGLLLNAATGVAALALLAMLLVSLALVPVAGLGLPPLARVPALVRSLARLQRDWASRVLDPAGDRAYRWHGSPRVPPAVAPQDAGTWRELAWLVVHGLTWPGPALVLWALLAAFDHIFSRVQVVVTGGLTTFAFSVAVVAIALITVMAVPVLRTAQAWLAARLLLPDATPAARIRQLTESRAVVVDAQAAELRRIERDLHDGAQAKLIAIRMNLGLARDARDGAQARLMIDEAREIAGQALTDLRDVVRGIHPPVLTDRGLAGAVQAAALLCPVPVTVEIELPGRLEAPVESAVYFAVAEALTNVARHSGASRAWLRLSCAGGLLRVTVRDDGRGGAGRAGGSGIRGIEARLSAFDGRLDVSSPPGGPTELTMEVPCAWS
ncbi:Sensor histidine kinase LiaS [Nonomuraea coxensis DSM 45129]|uniref:histidine kinase n=1 Tax=Nonomuraea coxensis DSM 45129 TaxID=1122611 RepID=A0ABX8U4P8_9ACTN|nr:histidine kinase [Nonomuraea coxensis]QYC41714.1 Sensor histidine kinase LiaS [Nonomuraea coxensis DSM 45129]